MVGTRLNDLRQKEIVDTATGMKLGEIIDLELDMHTGQITALIVPTKHRLGNLQTPRGCSSALDENKDSR